MATVSEVLENVLGKALPDLEQYRAKDSSDWDSKNWSLLEDNIGMVYQSYLRSLLRDPHIEYGNENLPYVIEPPGNSLLGENITLAAINQRGLYRPNGRKTMLEPCGKFLFPFNRITSSTHHDALHHVYMYLVRKPDSINQLFMATTRLGSIAVNYGKEGDTTEPTIDVPDEITEDYHVTFNISYKLVKFLVPKELRELWHSTIKQILNYSKAEELLRSIRERGRLPNKLSSIEDKAFQPPVLDLLEAIRKFPTLFSQWLDLYPHLQNFEEAGTLYGSWLRSFAWLQFYCQEEVAGRYFYTVRLPSIIKKPDHVFPESSITIISKSSLEGNPLERLISTRKALFQSPNFKKLKRIARKSVNEFQEYRRGAKDEPSKTETINDPLAKILQRLYSDKKYLAVDFGRLCFLLKLARHLVGKCHEGQPLRFCFIHGFGYERVDAESRGTLKDFRVDLRHRWNRFLEFAKPKIDNEEKKLAYPEIGKAMADWIKSNDLQLQRPDVAVYLEETTKPDYPVPVGLVQIRFLSEDESHPVGNELELHQALRNLTEARHRTVAIVTCPTGLFVFILGKCLLVRCSSNDKWEDEFYFHISGTNKFLEEQIDSGLKKVFKNTFNANLKVSEQAASMVEKLCRALVVMGHGCMLIVRTKKDKKRLPPLNPVWLLRSEIKIRDLKDFEKEIKMFALMAALDGATELLLPANMGGAIDFRCRRFAQTEPDNWIWEDDPDVPGNAIVKIRAPEYAKGLTRKQRIEKQKEEAKRKEEEKLLTNQFLGKGTRHHTALALSTFLKNKALVITVSADGPVTIFRNGRIQKIEHVKEIRFSP